MSTLSRRFVTFMFGVLLLAPIVIPSLGLPVDTPISQPADGGSDNGHTGT